MFAAFAMANLLPSLMILTNWKSYCHYWNHYQMNCYYLLTYLTHSYHRPYHLLENKMYRNNVSMYENKNVGRERTWKTLFFFFMWFFKIKHANTQHKNSYLLTKKVRIENFKCFLYNLNKPFSLEIVKKCYMSLFRYLLTCMQNAILLDPCNKTREYISP